MGMYTIVCDNEVNEDILAEANAGLYISIINRMPDPEKALYALIMHLEKEIEQV